MELIELTGKETIAKLKEIILATKAKYGNYNHETEPVSERDLHKLTETELLDMVERYNAKVENNQTPTFSRWGFVNPNMEVLKQKTDEFVKPLEDYLAKQLFTDYRGETRPKEMRDLYLELEYEDRTKLDYALKNYNDNKILRKKDIDYVVEKAKAIFIKYFPIILTLK